MSFTHAVTVPLAWDKAVQRTRDALVEQGFGVLTEINVRATFETKLGTDAADAVGDYVIHGACNPVLASRALAAEPELGTLLPCNVVVRRGEDARETGIEAIGPQTMVQLADTPAVRRSRKMRRPPLKSPRRPCRRTGKFRLTAPEDNLQSRVGAHSPCAPARLKTPPARGPSKE